jgi:adenylate kinase
VPRLSDELIIKCLKGRLALNDCLNRGYVLDAYPRSFDDANKLFKVVVEDEGGAGGDEEEETRIIDDKIRPDSAVFIKIKPETSLAEISKMSLQETAGTHHTEREFQRRYKIWESNNISANGSSVLTDFYSENNIEVLHWDASQMAHSNNLDCIKMYIEKDGKYNNYQSCYEDEESLRFNFNINSFFTTY